MPIAESEHALSAWRITRYPSSPRVLLALRKHGWTIAGNPPATLRVLLALRSSGWAIHRRPRTAWRVPRIIWRVLLGLRKITKDSEGISDRYEIPTAAQGEKNAQRMASNTVPPDNVLHKARGTRRDFSLTCGFVAGTLRKTRKTCKARSENVARSPNYGSGATPTGRVRTAVQARDADQSTGRTRRHPRFPRAETPARTRIPSPRAALRAFPLPFPASPQMPCFPPARHVAKKAALALGSLTQVYRAPPETPPGESPSGCKPSASYAVARPSCGCCNAHVAQGRPPVRVQAGFTPRNARCRLSTERRPGERNLPRPPLPQAFISALRVSCGAAPCCALRRGNKAHTSQDAALRRCAACSYASGTS